MGYVLYYLNVLSLGFCLFDSWLNTRSTLKTVTWDSRKLIMKILVDCNTSLVLP